MAQLPSKAPFSKRFEDAVGRGLRERGGAAGGQAVQAGGEHGAGASICATLERWAAAAAQARALRQMGVDEIHLGKKQKFLTVVSNLDTGEPLWFGRERKKETLDEFFQQELSARQRQGDRGGVRGHVGAVTG